MKTSEFKQKFLKLNEHQLLVEQLMLLRTIKKELKLPLEDIVKILNDIQEEIDIIKQDFAEYRNRL